MSDFANIDNLGTGAKPIDFSSARAAPVVEEPKSVVLNPATQNPFGAVTNSGSLKSGLPGLGGFGFDLPNKLSAGDLSLGDISSLTGLGSKRGGKWDDQTETDNRLAVVRSRAAKSLYSESGSQYSSDRGQIAFMKLLKGPDFDIKKATSGSSSKVDSEASQLTSSGYSSFFLTGVNVQYSEKTQIMTTFGDNEVVYYFGKQPTIFNITGLLFDSLENDWFSKFLTLYARVLRGTELAKNFNLVEITLPNLKLTGTISSLSHQQDSSRDTDIGFSFQFVAKEVEPLPTVMPKGSASNLLGSLIDFSADRGGAKGWGVSMSSGSLGGGFMNTIGDLTGSLGLGGLLSAGNAVGNALNSFRTSIFSPVFGIISSITKIVKSVTGSISKIISSFTNPVNQILRDITSLATQATAIAGLIENSFADNIAIPGRTITNVKNTIRSLKKTAGTISRVPENISQIFKRQFNIGRVKKNSTMLSSGKKRNRSKAAVLNSGVPYQPHKSYSL